MPVFNYAKKEVNVKVVYYGPGLSGKTTNIQQIHANIKSEHKGKLVSLATQTDRTLFFDFLPLKLGSLGNYKIRLHLYTVPGQVHYNATRKLVLKGVDGVVFVADSQKTMKDANIESFENLSANLESYGRGLSNIPCLIQGNKRDLEDILSMEELESDINRYGATMIEAVASDSQGVMETLMEIVKLTVRHLRDHFKTLEAKEPAKEAAKPAPLKPPDVEVQPETDAPLDPIGVVELDRERPPDPEASEPASQDPKSPAVGVADKEQVQSTRFDATDEGEPVLQVAAEVETDKPPPEIVEQASIPPTQPLPPDEPPNIPPDIIHSAVPPDVPADISADTTDDIREEPGIGEGVSEDGRESIEVRDISKEISATPDPVDVSVDEVVTLRIPVPGAGVAEISLKVNVRLLDDEQLSREPEVEGLHVPGDDPEAIPEPVESVVQVEPDEGPESADEPYVDALPGEQVISDTLDIETDGSEKDPHYDPSFEGLVFSSDEVSGEEGKDAAGEKKKGGILGRFLKKK